MPQPAITGTPPGLQFGGLAQPNGQGTLAYVNLNDVANWRWMGWASGNADDDFYLHTVGRKVWLGEGVFLGQDAGSRKFNFNFWYNEATTKLGAVLAQLSQAGQQNLTFDTGTPATVIAVKLARAHSRLIKVPFSPYQWNVSLEFIAPTPWFADVTATSIASSTIINAPTTAPSGSVAAGGALATGTYTLQYTFVAASGETAPSPASSNIVLTSGNQQISVSAVTPLPGFATAVKWYFGSGSPTSGFTVQNSGAAFTLNTAGNGVSPPATTPATQFNVTYAGSVFARPIWTFAVPNNTVAIPSFTLANTMSGETLTATFPGNLPANTAATVTIDAGAMTVKDANGVSYDVSGAFPFLYPPAGQVNTMTALITPVGTGIPGGCTISGSVNPRWLI